MGIRNLNKLIKKKCSNTIHKNTLSELSNKIIVVDISVYIFKFSIDNGLIDNMYIMLSLFKKYNIIPLFIFDGKRPEEKKDLLLQRREERARMKQKYDDLKCKLDSCDSDSDVNKEEILNNMQTLNKKLVVITKNDFNNVKRLINAFGYTYYEAPTEADELCSYLCLTGHAWACLSEDMDMFVYGCPRVIRCLNIMENSAVLYNTEQLVKCLNLNQEELRCICVLSGTDYNIDKNCDLYKSIELMEKFKNVTKCQDEDEYEEDDFYSWVHKNTDYIDDLQQINKINHMFEYDYLKDKLEFENYNTVSNYEVNTLEVQHLLSQVGFIFA